MAEVDGTPSEELPLVGEGDVVEVAADGCVSLNSLIEAPVDC